MGCTISCCAESGPAWLSFVQEITLCLEDMRPRYSARAGINHDPSATTSHCAEGVRMDARTVWFRETGEGRTKEQLLIETMFCVYYLSKSSAVLVTCALQSHSFLALLPPEPPWPVLSFCAKVSGNQRAGRPHRGGAFRPRRRDQCDVAGSNAPAHGRHAKDHKEGVEAFLGRRKPRFKGR